MLSKYKQSVCIFFYVFRNNYNSFSYVLFFVWLKIKTLTLFNKKYKLKFLSKGMFCIINGIETAIYIVLITA